MSHGPGCAGEAVVRVQGKRRKENKGTVTWVIVQSIRETGVVRVKEDRRKEIVSRS